QTDDAGTPGEGRRPTTAGGSSMSRSGRSAGDVLVGPGPAAGARERAARRQARDLDRRALAGHDGEAVVLADVAGVRDEDRQLRAGRQTASAEVLGEEEVVGRAAERWDVRGADLGAQHREVLRAEGATLAPAANDDVAALVEPAHGQREDAGVGGGEPERPVRARRDVALDRDRGDGEIRARRGGRGVGGVTAVA